MNCCQQIYTCDWCNKQLKGKRNLLYKFRGCGKYHNKKICNLCFQRRFGYSLDNDIDLSAGNDDPLGMKIVIYKRIHN
jgi:hypothetical protein